MLHKTEWKEYTEHGTKRRIRAEYGLRTIGNQDPYVSVTAEIEYKSRNNRWCDQSFGCMHEAVAKHFPQLVPLIRWHLTSTKEPMYYIANGIYWFEKMAGRSKWALSPGEFDPTEAFKSTIVFGAVDGDELPPLTATNEEVTAWLEARRDKLMERMRADVASVLPSAL